MRYLDLLTPANRMKPRFAVLAEAVLSQAEDLAGLLRGAAEALSPERAAGVQLDAAGALCGLPRPGAGTSDEAYRAYLRARIAARHWDGTNGALPEVLARAFPDGNVRLRDNQDGTVTIAPDGAALLYPPEAVLPLPAGIGLRQA